MAIRRSDTRRRRVGVLIDEHAPASVEPTRVKASPKKTRAKSEEEKPVSEYSVSARRRHLAKTTDLIPKRFWSVASSVFALACGLAAINVLYFYTAELVPVLGERAWEVFSLTHRGGLAQWFGSILLMFAGLASVQIYALRKHRSNDYVGTYALWLWIAITLLMASLSSAVGLHELAINSISYLTGTTLDHGGAILVTAKLLVIAAIAARLFVEVRQSRVAITGVVVVSGVFVAASLVEILPIKTRVGASYDVALGNLLLVGNTCLLLTVFSYARFVYLRAQGIHSEEAAAARAAAKLDAKEAKAQAKADKLAAKEQAKADRIAAIEQAKADKIAEKEQAIADKEQAKADKIAAIEQAKADRIAAKEQARADKEQAKADKIRAAEEAKMEKQLAKEQAKAEKQKAKTDRKASQDTITESEKQDDDVGASLESDSEYSSTKQSRMPQLKLQTRKSKVKTTKVSQSRNVDSESAEDSSSQDSISQLPLGGKLSKSKQRKLRKQQKQQRRAA